MEHYLDMLFGENEGYVAVASKGDTWEEKQFSWPSSRGRLLRWVDRRISHCNIFICPALRSERRRIKGDGVNLRWLWADIDWEKVQDKRPVVAALKKLLPARVMSGTGKNLHVYLELDKPVTVEQHYRLNQGLRDLLQADAKHPDNSLLRLPGTYNRKGRPVEVTWARDRSDLWTPANLLRIPAIRDTVVAGGSAGNGGDGTYDQVDVSLVPARAHRWASMDADQAIDVYGSRHAAVYAITEKLIKLGLDRDEIHTLLQEFEPGIQKQEDERGYDMHRDIDKCISRHPTLDQIIDDDGDGAIVELTDEEVVEENDKDFQKAAEKKVREWDIAARARQIQAHRSFLPPPDALTVYFSDQLAEPERETRYLIEGLASVGDNITVTGQYKTGKTLFVCNLVRALVEGEDFLEQFPVDDLKDCTVGLWSCEMTKDVLVNRYLRPQDFSSEGALSLIIWHGRGFGVNLMDDVGKQWAINWLRNEDVSVWVIDSFARICAMAGVEANDNDQVLRLLKTLDEIKHAAGVSELFLIAHTGRGELTKDRARGATVFDDWADARWVLTRESNVRFLKVEGRDVDLTPTSLKYDDETKRLTVGNGREDIVGASVQAIYAVVLEHEGVNKRTLCKLVRERQIVGLTDQNVVADMIEEAVELGWLSKKKTGKGRELAYHPLKDGTVPTGGTAGIRTLDFSKVKERQARVRS